MSRMLHTIFNYSKMFPEFFWKTWFMCYFTSLLSHLISMDDCKMTMTNSVKILLISSKTWIPSEAFTSGYDSTVNFAQIMLLLCMEYLTLVLVGG